MDTLKALGAMVAMVTITPGATESVLLGIPIALLLAGCAGAMFGLAYTPPEKWGKLLAIPTGPKWKRICIIALRAGGLIFTLMGIVFVMGWSTLAAPHVPGFGWTAAIPQAAVCGLLSFAGQFWLPRAIDAGNRWLESRGKTP